MPCTSEVIVGPRARDAARSHSPAPTSTACCCRRRACGSSRGASAAIGHCAASGHARRVARPACGDQAHGARRFSRWSLLAAAAPASAAEGALNGGTLSPLWVVPFAGILLSIAVAPVTAPSFWHHHFGKTSAFWALAFLVPFAAHYGIELAAREVLHTLLLEYVPFIVLLFALFTVSGGIHIRGNLHGSPRLNTGLLGLGTALASVMGTTGAAMLLIRPLLRANDNRRHKAHVVVFFIFLVANIGGALTPLGDPPLFLGFLKGVDFFWTTQAMLWPTLTATAILLAMFYAVDRWL